MTVRIGRILAALFCLLAASLAFVACGGSGGNTSAVLRVGTLGDIDSLNPFVAISNQAAEVTSLTLPTLVVYDNAGQIKPELARSWKISADGKSATFTLASGGKWSDGKPLTADDALWTIRTVLRIPTLNISSYAPSVAGVSSTGPTNLTVRFRTPAANALDQLTLLPIVPRHVWERYAKGDGKQLQTFTDPAPIVGGGPFYVRSYRKGQALTLDRNPGYFGPAPHVARIGFAFYSNPDALSSAVTHGEVDAAERVQPSGAKKLSSDRLAVEAPNSLNELFFTINSSPRAKHPELRDPLVRQALDLAIDRNRVVQTGYYGFGTPGSSMVPPVMPASHLQAAPTPFDIARANALLDQAGFKRGADGTRVANGHPMSYDVIVLQDPTGPETATLTILTEDFAKLGIKVRGRVLDAAAAVTGIFGPGNKYSTFDFGLLTVSGTVDPTAVLGYQLCASFGVSNFAGYCNPKYDALYAKVGATTDPAARKAQLDQLQQILLNDRPILLVAYAKDVYVHSTAWTGFAAGPGGWFQKTLETALSVQHK
ncbi:MAG TPA: peptide ABC transporter substrate-binding protein [Conexibacter sp.]|nr:peptide ABC transporter substrate-binding protein [Conexibacter sp.]